MSGQNIKPLEHQPFDWSDGKRTVSLKSVYDEIVGKLDDSITWYQTKRSLKRKLAWCFRVGAILLGAVATAMPTVAEIAFRDGQHAGCWLRPGTATIVGIMVGALILLDKLIGASSGWIRYTMAETSLKETRDELALAYTMEEAQWIGQSDASVEQTKHTLIALQGFFIRANQIVRDETNQWKAEFQSALAQTEEYAKAQPKNVEEAVLTIKLADPDRLRDGWSVSINGGANEQVDGDSKSFRLTPGTITVRVNATVKAGKDDSETKRFATETGDLLVAGVPKVITVTLPPKQT
jgi:uncharacterized protein YdeI (BOF family)